MRRWPVVLPMIALAGSLALATPAAPTASDVAVPAIPDGITRDPVAPRAEQSLDPAAGSTRAATRLLAQVVRVQSNLTVTSYDHDTKVDARHGAYTWDCSGMTTWLLRRSAPRAVAALGSARPVARDYFHAIARAPIGRARQGWQRLAHVRDARPGDLFAFLRSPLSQSKVTGHVGVIVGQPVEIPGWPGAYAVRIADSTRGGHQDDTRAYDGAGGFGFGTVVFVTDDTGTVVAYGWVGTVSAWLMPATVLFGRVTG